MLHLFVFRVLGKGVDSQARCQHYYTKEDIVAIKFPCCNMYYPCYRCHNEVADHPAKRWGHNEFGKRGILCGACGTEMTIQEYMSHSSACPTCKSHFNPNCEKHSHIYFEKQLNFLTDSDVYNYEFFFEPFDL